MVRKLLLVCCLFSSSIGFAVDELYLSNSEKAFVALVLKTAQEFSRSATKDLARQKDRLDLLVTQWREYHNVEPTVIEVASYQDFLQAQKSNPIFQDYRLDEVDDVTLIEMLKPVRFQSTSLRVQKKIENYEVQRSQFIRGFLTSLGLEILRRADLKSLTSEGLKRQLKAVFNEKATELTQNLSAQNSVQVLVLGKLLKLYFKNLPDYQKIEILYRISQMPLQSKPMDVLLTMIQNSGPQMQKLIQIMGRSEHVPTEFQEIFQKLESQVQKVPWWKVHETLLRKNVKLDEFTYFEKDPIGVGTMAQTHRAQYVDENGIRHSVVLRYLKPDIEMFLEMDHQILKKIAIEIDDDPELKSYRLPSLNDLVEDLHNSVVEELDVRATVRQQTRGRRIYSRSEVISFNRQKNFLRLNVPDATMYSDESGVMIQELVHGKKPIKEFSQFKEIYPDLYRVVSEKIAEAWVEEAFFKSGFFHADLHQGNIMASVSDQEIQVHILDFGMTGELMSELRESALLLALGIKLDRADLIAENFMRLGKMNNPKITGPKLSRLVQARIDRLQADPGLGGSLEAWTAWALDLGLEIHYEFLKLNRGLTAIEGLLSDSKSKLSLEKLAQKVALRNKSYVTQLLLQEPKMRISDYAQLVSSLFDKPRSKKALGAAVQCRALFE